MVMDVVERRGSQLLHEKHNRRLPLKERTAPYQYSKHKGQFTSNRRVETRVSERTGVRMKSFGETRCMNPQNRKPKLKWGETQRSLQKFLEPTRKPKFIDNDNSFEIHWQFCEDLSWFRCTSTPHRSETNGISERAVCRVKWRHLRCFCSLVSIPHRSETNGIAERAVRRVKEGTSAVLLQSGLNECWWADSMECCTYLRNIQDLLSDGKTPNERRFGIPFNGPEIPFGAMVEYHPVSAKDQSRLHQSGKDIMVADN